MEPDAAEAEAGRRVAEDMRGLDAIHALDFIAGGDGKISGLGDRTINRSIGAQWMQAGQNSKLSRREQLQVAADRAQRAGKAKMDVELQDCEDMS